MKFTVDNPGDFPLLLNGVSTDLAFTYEMFEYNDADSETAGADDAGAGAASGSTGAAGAVGGAAGAETSAASGAGAVGSGAASGAGAAGSDAAGSGAASGAGAAGSGAAGSGAVGAASGAGASGASNDGIKVNIKVTEEKTYAPDDDDILIFVLRSEQPFITSDDPAVMANQKKLEKAADDKFEQFRKGAGDTMSIKECIDEAKRQYAADPSGFNEGETPLVVSRLARTERADKQIVSVLYNEIYNLHGGRINRGFSAQNFDVKTGKELTLKDISASGKTSTLAMKLVAKAEWLSKQDAYSDAEPSYEIGWTDHLLQLVREGHWFFDDRGISVYANEGEICPVIAGPQFFQVTYDELEGLVKDEYLVK